MHIVMHIALHPQQHGITVMSSYPHHYVASASALRDGNVALESPGLPALSTAPPAEFGGPGDHWSPETLCVGAVANCFVLTFRAVARAAQLPWLSLRAEAVGTLDRVERSTQFTHFTLRAALEVPAGVSEAEATAVLERAERACLIRNSLKATSQLDARIETRA
jgi:organic hydroperoxide reductase OsmC/OhrA